MKESTNIILKAIVITLMILFVFGFAALSFELHEDFAQTKQGQKAWRTLFNIFLFVTPPPVCIMGGFIIWPKIKYYQKEYERQNKGKKGKKKKKKKRKKK